MANKLIEEEPEEVQGENLEVGPKEYQETDYKSSDEESEEDEGTRGILSES